MSELPAIDAARLSKKLMSEISELTYQKYQLEVLAETLRDERDQARSEKNAIIEQIKAQQSTPPKFSVVTEFEGADAPVAEPQPSEEPEVYNITTVDEGVA